MKKRIFISILAVALALGMFTSCAAQPDAPDAKAQSGKVYALQQDFEGSTGQGIMAPQVDSKGRLVVASQADGAPVVLTTYGTDGKKISDVTTDVTAPASNFTLDLRDTAYILAGSNVDILDASGKTATKVPVGDVVSQQEAQINAKSGRAARTGTEGMIALGFAASSDGNIFISFTATGVVEMDKTGKQVRAFGAGSMNLICMDDKEQLMVYPMRQDRPTLTTYNTQSGSQAGKQDVSFRPILLFYDRQGKRLLYMDGEGIYPVKADGTSGDALVMLSNFPLSGAAHRFAGFAMDGAGTIYVASSDSSNPGDSMGLSGSTADRIDRLLLVDASTIPQKKTLTIAGLMEGGGEEAAIVAFQKAHPDYRIDLKTYSNQIAGLKGSGQSADSLIQRFNTDIMAGNGADVYILHNLPYEKYIQDGLLADLGPMMTADTMDMSQYYTNIFDACRVDGKLYTLPTAFSYDAFIGNAAYMPASDTPSMDDFFKAADALPADVAALPKEDALQALADYMDYSVTHFVDMGAKTATFNSPEFIGVLNRFKKLTDTKMGQKSPEDQDPLEQVGDGSLAFTVEDIRELKDFSSFMAFAGGKVRFENMPSLVPDTYSFRVRELYGISASSPSKDIAWEFIKTLLSPDIQSNPQEMNGFPVSKAAMQDIIRQEVASTGSISSNGERQVEIKPLTQAQCDAFTANFDKLNTTLFAPGQKMEDIMSVLKDELPSFFSGQKSADDVAALIQNRVQTILSE